MSRFMVISVTILAIQLNTVAQLARSLSENSGASRTSDFDLVVHLGSSLKRYRTTKAITKV